MDWSFPLLAACERTPRRPALRHRGSELSFAELERRIAGLTAGLRAGGLAGATVAWMLPNAPEAIEVSMALARLGAVSVPLNPRLAPDEIAFMLDDSGVTALIVDPSLSERLAADRRALPEPAQLRDAPAEAPDPERVSDEALATVLYTSGTTGSPKGVMRSHRANAWNVVNHALGAARTVGDVELFNLPAFGIGLLHFALPALLGGAVVVLDDVFAADRAWPLLADHAVTRTFLAPTMISAMLGVEGQERYELPALTTIDTAYEFPEILRRRAIERFGDLFVYLYGLTEAQLTGARRGQLSEAPDVVGTGMGALRIRIDGPDERGVGEIALQGPAAMDGYLGRPEETAQALRDGWVLTGDLGRIDADGDLHYAGRLKEMVKTGGFSVDPVEVEHALTAVDGIEAAAVIGVPDAHWGEMLVAYVVTAGAAFDEAGTIRACRSRLSGFKVPKRVLRIDALPLNATGKVQRGRLRERYGAGGG